MYIVTKHEMGFTLVELIISVVIVAILSMVSIFAYQGSVEKARETEIYTNVTNIIDALKIYMLENEHYPTDIFQLPMRIEGKKVTIDGIKGIQTKDFFYAFEQEKEDTYTIDGFLYVYMNKAKYSNSNPKFGLRLMYVKVPEWYFTGSNGIRTTVTQGGIVSWVSMYTTASSGSKEIDSIFYKTRDKFDCTVW